MPTKKPVVQVVLDQDIFDKLIKICEKEERSTSNKCKQIIKEYVIKYELVNGSLDESITELRTPIDDYKITYGNVTSKKVKSVKKAVQMTPETIEVLEDDLMKRILKKYENETL